jgi:hypothetical protein
MRFAHFVTIPPLEDVKGLFTATTSRPFGIGVSWTTWGTLDPDHILEFQPYIRPCHQRILMETVNDAQSPCAFLRQLLKPHGFNIINRKGEYTLDVLKGKTHVNKKEGITVVME